MSSSWRQSTWGEEISLEYGKAIRGYQGATGTFRVFGSNGPIGRTDKALAQGPGVILGRKGAYRGVQFSLDPFFVIDTAYYVRPKTDLDMRWLYYAIIHHKLGEIDDGSPIPSTTRAAVYITDVDVPPIEEQREIAAILGALDDKIEVNRKTAVTLEEMARALYRSWFVDFDPVHAKAAGRAPVHMDAATAALFPDSFGEDGLPEGWSETKLGDIITRLKVGKLFSQKTVSQTGNVPVLDQGKQGVIGFHDEEPNIVARPDRRVSIFANHTCVQRLLQEPFSTIQNVIPFVGDELPTEFCHYSSLGKQEFEEYRGHWPSFVDAKCNVPQKELAEAFASEVSPWLDLVFQASTENQTLATLRDTLLPRLMSGELRLGEAKEQVAAVA